MSTENRTDCNTGRKLLVANNGQPPLPLKPATPHAFDDDRSVGPNDPGVEAAIQEKVTTLISRRGPELEALLLLRDPERSGNIPVKAFSECLRAWVSSDSERGGGDAGTRGGKREGPNQAAELTHADRKVLYRRWVVRGQVRYVDFLGASGYFNAPLPRYSEISTAVAAAPAAAAAPVVADAPARHPVTGKRASGRLPSGDKAGMHARNADAGEEETGLLARARVVLVHLSEVGYLRVLCSIGGPPGLG